MKKVMMLSAVSLSLLLGSCVSKKKYTELETQLDNTQSELMKTRVDKEDCEEKYAQVQERVSNYYAKINSLQEENDNKLEMVDNIAAMSTKSKEAMRKTLAKVDPEKLKDAKTLSDSIDVAVSYNLTKSLNEGEDDGIDINVEETVVQITISDELLFKSGSYWVNPKANKLLEKIAKVVKSCNR